MKNYYSGPEVELSPDPAEGTCPCSPDPAMKTFPVRPPGNRKRTGMTPRGADRWSACRPGWQLLVPLPAASVSATWLWFHHHSGTAATAVSRVRQDAVAAETGPLLSCCLSCTYRALPADDITERLSVWAFTRPTEERFSYQPLAWFCGP